MTSIGAAWTTLLGTSLNEFDGDVMTLVAKLRQRIKVLTSNGPPVSEEQKAENCAHGTQNTRRRPD